MKLKKFNTIVFKIFIHCKNVLSTHPTPLTFTLHCFIWKVCLRNYITFFFLICTVTLKLLLNRKTRLFHHNKFLENVKGLKTNLVLVILLFERVRLYEFYYEFTLVCLNCFQTFKYSNVFFYFQFFPTKMYAFLPFVFTAMDQNLL